MRCSINTVKTVPGDLHQDRELCGRPYPHDQAPSLPPEHRKTVSNQAGRLCSPIPPLSASLDMPPSKDCTLLPRSEARGPISSLLFGLPCPAHLRTSCPAVPTQLRLRNPTVTTSRETSRYSETDEQRQNMRDRI